MPGGDTPWRVPTNVFVKDNVPCFWIYLSTHTRKFSICDSLVNQFTKFLIDRVIIIRNKLCH